MTIGLLKIQLDPKMKYPNVEKKKEGNNQSCEEKERNIKNFCSEYDLTKEEKFSG